MKEATSTVVCLKATPYFGTMGMEADAVLARRDGVEADPLSNLFPTVEDGVLGVKFVDAAVASHQRDSRWVDAIVDVQ